MLAYYAAFKKKKILVGLCYPENLPMVPVKSMVLIRGSIPENKIFGSVKCQMCHRGRNVLRADGLHLMTEAMLCSTVKAP